MWAIALSHRMEITPPAVPPPLPPPPPFRLHPSAWILWGLATLVILSSAVFKTRGLDPAAAGHVWGERVGRSLALLLFPALISWVVWRFSGRSKIAAMAVFFALFGLSIVGQLLPLVSGPLLAGFNDGVALQEAGKKYVAEMSAAKDRYEAAIAKVDSSHILDFVWLTEQSKIGPRRTAVQELIAVNAEFRQTVANGEKLYRAALVEKGVSARSSESAVIGFKKAQADKVSVMLKIRDLDEEVFVAVLKVLNLLDAEWGHWTRDNGQIAFERDAALAQFNAALGDVQAAAKAQAAAQQQLGLTTP